MQSFIEIAISVLLLFLLVSIVVTAMNEIISRLLRLRGAFLFDGIKTIIDNKELCANFYASGIIFTAEAPKISDKPDGAEEHSLSQKLVGLTDRTGHPSYIHATNFAKALVQALVRKDGESVVASFDDVKASIVGLPKGRIKDVLVSALNEGATEVKALETAIATWYRTATERLSGKYKRFKQAVSFVLGLALAVGFNIDTLKFASYVQSDPELRAMLVDQAVGLAKADDALGKCGDDPAAPAPDPNSEEGQQAAIEDIDCYAKVMSDAFGDLHRLPIGWTSENWADFKAIVGIDVTVEGDATKAKGEAKENEFHLGLFLRTLLGWLITGLAVTMGAPFWFDLLKSFVNLRPSGQPPKENAPSEKAGAT